MEKKGKLKGIIFAAGKTQRELSFDTRIPEIRLSRFINGRLELKEMEIESLARVLNVPRADLFALK